MHKIIIAGLLSLMSFVGAQQALLRDHAQDFSRFPENERTRLKSLSKSKMTKQLKLVALDPRALSKEEFQVHFFDEGQTFRVTTREGNRWNEDSSWQAEAPPPAPLPAEVIEGKKRVLLDRMHIRRIGGRYTGFFISRNRLYQLQPISNDVGVLIEETIFQNGNDSIKTEARGQK